MAGQRPAAVALWTGAQPPRRGRRRRQRPSIHPSPHPCPRRRQQAPAAAALPTAGGGGAACAAVSWSEQAQVGAEAAPQFHSGLWDHSLTPTHFPRWQRAAVAEVQESLSQRLPHLPVPQADPALGGLPLAQRAAALPGRLQLAGTARRRLPAACRCSSCPGCRCCPLPSLLFPNPTAPSHRCRCWPNPCCHTFALCE